MAESLLARFARTPTPWNRPWPCTDGMAAGPAKPVVLTAYPAVRGCAPRHIEAALPEVGDPVLKFAR